MPRCDGLLPVAPWHCGSSPRTWGTLVGAHVGFPDDRFIPTHVGNTCHGQSSGLRTPVHPHARGEHSSGPAGRSRFSGSSPRTWGTPPMHRRRDAGSRFIPTHVGNTPIARRSAMVFSVHPHARGEHDPATGGQYQSDGSSPRTWGTLVPKAGCPVHRRFIPTHVGNTGHPGCMGYRVSVHPHARGEHTVFSTTGSARIGSSPRTWGTLLAAGTGSPRRTVHPHARGEHRPDLRAPPNGIGSSPRTWGTHPRCACARRRWRFIPTHVGNTR